MVVETALVPGADETLPEALAVEPVFVAVSVEPLVELEVGDWLAAELEVPGTVMRGAERPL